MSRAVPPRSLWRDREVVGLLGAQVTSEVGDQFARVAVTYLVLREAGSTFLAAMVLALSYVPSVFGGVVLGPLADRLSRRRLMIVCDLLRLVLVAALAAVVAGAPLWLPFAVLLVVELVSVPFDAARQATWPDVAPEPGRLQRVTGLSRMLQQGNLVLGLALGGVLTAVTSPRTALVVDALTFLGSALLLAATLRERGRPLDADAGGFLQAVRDGARAVLGDPVRRALVGLGWGVGAVAIAPEAVALTYAVQQQAAGLGGLLLAAVPAGGFVGAAMAATRPPAVMLRLLLPMAAASCVPLLLTGLDPGVAGAVVLWFLAGLCQGLFLPTVIVTVNLVTPAALRGRVAALAGAGFALLSTAALGAVGALADLASPATAVALAGAAGLLVAAVAALGWPGRELAAVALGAPRAGRHAAGRTP